MNISIKFASFTVLLLIGIGLLGCGSNDSETTDAASGSVPKAIFIDRGDRICQDNYSKRTKLLTQLGKKYFKENTNPPPQEKQEELLVDEVMPIFREESEELNDLPLPDEDAKEAEAILAALEESIEGVEANPARSLQKGTGVEFSEAEKLAKAYGFKWCGRS